MLKISSLPLRGEGVFGCDVITDYLHYDDNETDQNEPIYSAFVLQDPEKIEMVEGFVNIHMSVMLREIDKAIQQQDWQGLKIKLYELKEIACTVGYMILVDVAKQMEFQALNQSPVELKLLFDKLTAIARRISLGINSASNQNTADNADK